MSKIQVMDEILANKIAAGEVVEKCASVVKELVENSIDAGSTEIKVELIDAGTKQIKVIDNGCGMDEKDAKMAFFRHATSKIKNEDDLFNIHTLGFRGEALASICSVSQIILKTCDGKKGTIIKIDGGKIINVKSSDLRCGTEITVSNLFYNTPARLKHLRSLYTELANITDYMNKLSLSHPEIRFTLINNENILLQTDGTNNLLKVISAIYGINIAKNMLEINGENSDYEITGYISKPEVQRASRNYMITLVNGRVVKNGEINKIINDSYHSYKPDNRYPITVININVDPTIIDVNIHPTKMDIKFSNMDTLLELISSLIKNKLGKQILIPKVEIEEKPIVKEYSFDLKREESSVKENFIYEEIIVNDEIFSEENLEEKEKFPELYPVGLVHGTYIICQNEKGMYLIDQHAAKERINYEKYRQKLFYPDKICTDLLFPITIELSNREFIIIKENFELLENLGIKIEEFGINSVIIKRHPIWLPVGYEEKCLKNIIDIILTEEKNFSLEKFNDHVAATIACKASIKANTNIAIKEMENLLDDLKKCDNPFNCPHGRPTMIFYSISDLERLFKRSGFDNII